MAAWYLFWVQAAVGFQKSPTSSQRIYDFGIVIFQHHSGEVGRDLGPRRMVAAPVRSSQKGDTVGGSDDSSCSGVSTVGLVLVRFAKGIFDHQTSLQVLDQHGNFFFQQVRQYLISGE